MDNHRGTSGGHHCFPQLRVVAMVLKARAIPVGPTIPRQTNPAPRLSSSPAAQVPDSRQTTYKDPRRFRSSW